MCWCRFSSEILFILIGITGEYLARILEEVRGRPRFVISDRTVRVAAPVEESTQETYATVA